MPEEFNGMVAFYIAIDLSNNDSFASKNSTRKLSNGVKFWLGPPSFKKRDYIPAKNHIKISLCVLY